MDFNLTTYERLITTFGSQGYEFQTFREFLLNPGNRIVILRHDVEAKYKNALMLANIQARYHIKGTYYFRFLPEHFDTAIIREIAFLGHEIGYHYDDLSHCHGNYAAAIRRFEKNLAILREIADVKTICMEGAPLSKWDNRDLWGQGDRGTRGQGDMLHGKANYRDFGIIGEPYFDIDFSKVFYLTDTGRRWDGKASVRDKVSSRQSAVGGQRSAVSSRRSAIVTEKPGIRNQELTFRHTKDIIAAARSGLLPDQIMFTFHPQRWTDKLLPWTMELVLQNLKNIAKQMVVRFKG